MGARHALFIDSSDDIDIEIIYQDSAGVPVDLTGFTFQWVFEIKGVILTATIGSGLTITPLLGKIVLHFDANTLDVPVTGVPLPQGLGEHRLEILTPVDKTLIRGALTNDT